MHLQGLVWPLLSMQPIEQMKDNLLHPWQWSAFLEKPGGLSAIYFEADDSASKRCISKVGDWFRVHKECTCLYRCPQGYVGRPHIEAWSVSSA